MIREINERVIVIQVPLFTSTCLTAPFNNMRSLKFKAQPTNAFFATVNQMSPVGVSCQHALSLNTFFKQILSKGIGFAQEQQNGLPKLLTLNVKRFQIALSFLPD